MQHLTPEHRVLLGFTPCREWRILRMFIPAYRFTKLGILISIFSALVRRAMMTDRPKLRSNLRAAQDIFGMTGLLVDEVARLVLGAVRHGHHVLAELWIEHGNRLIEMIDTVSDRDRDRKRSRAVDLDDLAPAQLTVQGHLAQTGHRVANDFIVLCRRPEPDFEDPVDETHVIRTGHEASLLVIELLSTTRNEFG